MPARRLRAAAALLLLAAAAASPEADTQPAAWSRGTLDAALRGLPPTTTVLLEFYAHWCPACQRFQPEFEKAAAALAGSGIVVARVDCADDGAVCARFGVRGYPTIRLGPAAGFLDAKKQPGLVTYEGAHDGAALAAWARGAGDAPPATPAPTEAGAAAGGATPEPVKLALPAAVRGREGGRWESGRRAPSRLRGPSSLPALQTMDASDAHKATMLAFKYALQGGASLEQPGARGALRAFAALAAAAHPVAPCRAGGSAFVAELDRVWPTDAPPPPGAAAALAAVPICGAAPEPPHWHACAPSDPASGKRGYTCGLWTLFHATAAGVGDGENAGAGWVGAVAAWVAHFFQCAECASHFAAMASSPGASAVRSGADARLWAWRAHNEVNDRLAAVEAAAGGGDAAHPKEPWPPATLCPTCSAPARGAGGAVQWDESAVAAFLTSYYLAPGVPPSPRATTALGGRRGGGGFSGESARSGAGSPLVGVGVFCVVAAGAAAGARAGGRARKGGKASE
jgi:thiol oxidase